MVCIVECARSRHRVGAHFIILTSIWIAFAVVSDSEGSPHVVRQ